jgi:hypothetical protein
MSARGAHRQLSYISPIANAPRFLSSLEALE